MNPKTITWAIMVFLSLPVAPLLAQPSGFYKDYALVLNKSVSPEGLVDYRSLKSERGSLDRFAESLASVSKDDYETWTEKEKIAFWINAYNAFTLQTILDHYPIRKSGLSSKGKSGGIRDIPGAWDGIKHKALGENMVLNRIEHKILRKQFKEPRIHFALVCASRGCPLLRKESYVAERLGEQLDDQVRGFLSNPEKFRIDTARHKVFLSSIFKWFGNDFEAGWASGSAFKGYSRKDGADLNFISRYLGDEERKRLLAGKMDVEYLDYDWSLNDQNAR